MRRVLLIVAFLLANLTIWGQQKYDNEFTQLKYMKVSGKTVEKVGHIVFDGVDHLTMNYTEPEGDFFIIDDNIVKINMDGKNVEIDANKLNSVGVQRAILLYCLSGNWQQIETDYNAESIVTEENGTRTVFIDAKGNKKITKGGYISVTLTYRIPDGALLMMILEQKNGIINTYEIKYTN